MIQSVVSPITAIESPENEWEEMPIPDISDIVTEDDTPVDNLISEKQQRLLTNSLYSSLDRDFPFLATANVGLFYGAKRSPLVPDTLLSFRVSMPQDWTQKHNRSYFLWNFGKPPEVAVEIVSNKVGNELGSKLTDYADASVAYYVVFDPLLCLGEKPLYVYELRATQYHLLDDYFMPNIDLGLTLWQGKFEDKEYTWLRWCDRDGNILLTGDEKAQQERQRADNESQRADNESQRAEKERQRADNERQRAEKLAEFLKSQGFNPEEI